MKRSEILEILSSYLEHKYNFQSYTFQSTAAKEILALIESKGMLPPAYEKLVEAKGIASPSPDIKLYYKLPCNEWEPEND